MSKPRIPWDGDNAVAGGKTSIAVLLEWLSAPGNYDRWRDAQRNVNGHASHATHAHAHALEPHVSKIELAREVLRLLATHGITHRLARDVRWKINAFCRSYASAALFLRKYEREKHELLRKAMATSANPRDAQRAIDSSEARVMTHVYTLCPFFDVLDPIMKDDMEILRAAEMMNKIKKEKKSQESSMCGGDDEDDNDGDDDSEDSGPGCSEEDSLENFFEPERTRHQRANSNSNSINRKKRHSRDNSTDGDDDEEHERKEKKLQFRKHEHELLLANLELDNKLKKIQLEREKLMMTKEVVLGRKQLLDAGIPQHEIDVLFPMRSFIDP